MGVVGVSLGTGGSSALRCRVWELGWRARRRGVGNLEFQAAGSGFGVESGDSESPMHQVEEVEIHDDDEQLGSHYFKVTLF